MDFPTYETGMLSSYYQGLEKYQCNQKEYPPHIPIQSFEKPRFCIKQVEGVEQQEQVDIGEVAKQLYIGISDDLSDIADQ